MGQNLTGKKIKNTYQWLLHVGATAIGALTKVSLGNGTDSALSISDSAAKVDGDLEVTGKLTSEDVLATKLKVTSVDELDDDSVANLGTLKKRTQYETTWSRFDQAGVIYATNGGIASDKEGFCYLTVKNTVGVVSPNARLISILPRDYNGIRPSTYPLVAEMLLTDSISSANTHIRAYIILGSYYTAPVVPSATTQGVALKIENAGVCIISSDGTTLNSSPLASKTKSNGLGMVKYRIEVDGTEARLFRRINTELEWILIATVIHPTPNFHYPNRYYGASAIIQNDSTSIAGNHQNLSLYDFRVAWLNPKFL